MKKVLLTLMLATTPMAFAQTDTTNTDTGTVTTQTTQEEDRGGFPWGLLGLAGLAGLMNRGQQQHHTQHGNVRH